MNDTIEVPLHDVLIDRGTTVISIPVPVHEIDVLRAVHGVAEVQDRGPNGEDAELDGSADAEWARLTRKYHRLNTADPVGIAYRTGPSALKAFGFELGRGASQEAPQAGIRDHKVKKAALVKPSKAA